MKPSLQAVLIAPDAIMRANILAGVKQITIREGHRDYEAGRTLMICCHLEPWAVQADITDVRLCTLAEVTQEEWEADGFVSQQDLLAGLLRYYPSMTADSPVTVLRWANVRGALVDD